MHDSNAILDLGRRLQNEVIAPMKRAFVAKDEIIDLLGIALVSGENIFLHGPPGTAKSALVHDLSKRLHGQSFDYLLTRFTEPNELFGPFDIRRLRDGDLVTNTEGMLPEASLVFLDELLNANSAILNSLLMALNERIFRRGRETRSLPVVSFIGASNHLPEDDALRALFDRFILRVRCDNVPGDRLTEVLAAGWQLQNRSYAESTLSFDDLRALHKLHASVNLAGVSKPLAELITKIRISGLAVSDRRAVRLQRIIAGSALLCGRLEARVSDLWVLKHVWDTEEQQEPLRAIVQAFIDAVPADGGDHPRSRSDNEPDPEALAKDLEAIEDQIGSLPEGSSEISRLRDKLALLDARVPWVTSKEKRNALVAIVSRLWARLKAPDTSSS